MAGKHTYNCPVCGAEKMTVNHWSLVWFTGQHGAPEFSVRPWDEETARLDDDALTVDGAGCVHKLLDKFLSTVAGQPAANPLAKPGALPGPLERILVQFQNAPGSAPFPPSIGSTPPASCAPDPPADTSDIFPCPAQPDPTAEPPRARVDLESASLTPGCSQTAAVPVTPEGLRGIV